MIPYADRELVSQAGAGTREDVIAFVPPLNYDVLRGNTVSP
jgi:hypothetical protein